MLLWTNHVTEEHYGIIENLREKSFESVEIPIGDGEIKDYKKLGDFISGLGMNVTGVTSLLEETNIASPDAAVRAAGIERMKWVIDVATASGMQNVCGPFHSAFAYFTRQPPTQDERKWSIEGLRKIGELAEGSDLMMTPEALNRFECYLINTMSDLAHHLDQVDHPNVGAIYDTHHANIEEKSHAEAIKTIARHLKHVHISENDRGTPGKGMINWNEVFATLHEINYQGRMTIESFSTTIPEFANAINVWRNYSSADEVYQEGYDFIKNNYYNS